MESYRVLLDYYRACFALVDTFHFNSEVSAEMYRNYLGDIEGKVIPITHAGISDHRSLRQFDESQLVIGFIGNPVDYKGFPLLRDIVVKKASQLQFTKQNIQLHVWGNTMHINETHDAIHFKGRFNQNQLTAVYSDMDVLVVPSICKETFSLVTLEALSYGVPVIVSSNVGARIIVHSYDPNCIYQTSKQLEELLDVILQDRSILIEYNKKICETDFSYTLEKHAKDIIDHIYDNTL